MVMKSSNPARAKKRRSTPLAPPETASQILYAEIPRDQIATYRFLIEAYDNLAIMSVVDRFRAVIKVRFTPDARKTVTSLLASQGAKILPELKINV